MAVPGWRNRAHGLTLWPLIVGAALTVAVLDYVTGPYVYITVLYLMPILALGWYVSLRSAIALTLGVMLYRVLLYSTIWRSSGPGLGVSSWNLASEAGFIALIVTLMARLKAAMHDAHRLALTDDLTGIANRRAFYQRASLAIDQALRSDLPLTLAYLDVDDFKQVNDRLGHLGGDRVLALLARTLLEAVRPTDLVARLGGDEFAVLMPATGTGDARRVSTILQQRLQAAMGGEGLPATFSIGVLTFVRAPASVDDLVARADAMMYAAKSRGKNALMLATAGTDEAAA